MLLTDLGAGEYTRDYFSDGRYGILCNRSLGHSVPLINGQEQCAGKEYAADAFCWEEKDKTLTISFGGAYPDGCIHKIQRSIRAWDEDVQLHLCVEDSFEVSKQTRTITENLVTQYLPIVEGNVIQIQGNRAKMEITVEGADGDIQILSESHSNHNGQQEPVYLVQWNVKLQGKDTACNMSICCSSR